MGKKILVVDDDSDFREAMSNLLSSRGYEVLTAENGASGFATAKNAKPNLILLDVMMPGLDGYEVCRRLKADSDSASIPVLMLTALSAREEMVQAMEAGADDLLGKPFSGLELLMRVRCLLRIKKLQDQLESYRRMATVGEMVSGIAYEMRNPLAITSSAAQILLKKGDDPTLRQECAEKIRAATHRAAAIIESFLRGTRPAGALMEPLGGDHAITVPVDGADGLGPVAIQA